MTLQILLLVSVSAIVVIFGGYYCFAIEIIVLLVLFWIFRIRTYLAAKSSGNWIRTTAIVKNINVVKNRGYMYGSIKTQEVIYEYSAGGKKYISSRYSIFPDNFRLIGRGNRYQVGQPISIIYDPKKPSRAAEIKMTQERLFNPVWIILTVIFTSFALIYLIFN